MAQYWEEADTDERSLDDYEVDYGLILQKGLHRSGKDEFGNRVWKDEIGVVYHAKDLQKRDQGSSKNKNDREDDDDPWSRKNGANDNPDNYGNENFNPFNNPFGPQNVALPGSPVKSAPAVADTSAPLGFGGPLFNDIPQTAGPGKFSKEGIKNQVMANPRVQQAIAEGKQVILQRDNNINGTPVSEIKVLSPGRNGSYIVSFDGKLNADGSPISGQALTYKFPPLPGTADSSLSISASGSGLGGGGTAAGGGSGGSTQTGPPGGTAGGGSGGGGSDSTGTTSGTGAWRSVPDTSLVTNTGVANTGWLDTAKNGAIGAAKGVTGNKSFPNMDVFHQNVYYGRSPLTETERKNQEAIVKRDAAGIIAAAHDPDARITMRFRYYDGTQDRYTEDVVIQQGKPGAKNLVYSYHVLGGGRNASGGDAPIVNGGGGWVHSSEPVSGPMPGISPNPLIQFPATPAQQILQPKPLPPLPPLKFDEHKLPVPERLKNGQIKHEPINFEADYEDKLNMFQNPTEQQKGLDEIVTLLKNNPNFIVVVSGNTQHRASDADANGKINVKYMSKDGLSEETRKERLNEFMLARAMFIKRLLVARKVNPNRIRVKTGNLGSNIDVDFQFFIQP